MLRGLAPDGGLYMPVEIARRSPEELEEFRELPFTEVCFRVVRPFAAPDVPEEVLVADRRGGDQFSGEAGFAFAWAAHSRAVSRADAGVQGFWRAIHGAADGIFCSRGDAAADGAGGDSGDTGSAVAHGFLGVPGIRVVILYPSKRISEAQEKQFTTLGENITALEVAGSV